MEELIHMAAIALPGERRLKRRFEMQREIRYKLTTANAPVRSGVGHTLNIGSGGVAFVCDHRVEEGSFVELSIAWPAKLNDSCPMRLIVFGRVLRGGLTGGVASIDKYEFRTAARGFQPSPAVRVDGMLERFADGIRRSMMKENLATA